MSKAARKKPKKRKELKSIVPADSRFCGAFLAQSSKRIHLEFLDGDNFGHAVALLHDEAFDLAVRLIALARKAAR